MISIMIPTMSAPLLDMTLKSIKRNLVCNPQVLVFDNTDGKQGIEELVAGHSNSCYMAEHRNIGIPRAYAALYEAAEHNIIFTADDDYYYLPGWDTELIDHMERDDRTKELYSRAPVMIEHLGGNPWTICQDFGTSISNFREEDVLKAEFNMQEKPNPHCPVAVTKHTWERLGGWDTDYFPGFGADPDFLHRLYIQSGKQRDCLLNAPGSYYYHFSGSTSGALFSHVPRSESHEMFARKNGSTIKSFVQELS